jgi:hypothetical protein
MIIMTCIHWCPCLCLKGHLESYSLCNVLRNMRISIWRQSILTCSATAFNFHTQKWISQVSSTSSMQRIFSFLVLRLNSSLDLLTYAHSVHLTNFKGHQCVFFCFMRVVLSAPCPTHQPEGPGYLSVWQ